MADLAAIIDSWERLSTASMDGYSDQGRLNHLRLLARFRDDHFAALLAVCKAAVEMRSHVQLKEAVDGSGPIAFLDAGFESATVAFDDAAFDAAVRGDAATGEGRNG